MKNIISLARRRRTNRTRILTRKIVGQEERDSGELCKMFRQLTMSLNTESRVGISLCTQKETDARNVRVIFSIVLLRM